MAHCSTAPLAAAVSAAGGLGCIGGLGYTPLQLRGMIRELKEEYGRLVSAATTTAADSRGRRRSGGALAPPPCRFGVDLALPKVGGGARATNHDYTHGRLDELIDVIVDEGARLFVSAVGVPPSTVITRLHGAGIYVMNMVGRPEHAVKAFEAGVDIVCAQGGEGGGHTGEIPGNLLVPACVDVARRYEPEMLRGGKGLVVAAGGIYDGRGLAAALVQGATGVWVGTRFVASEEAGVSRVHKEAVVTAGWDDTVKTLVISGRPLRVKRNEYLDDWERRKGEMRELVGKGVVPMMKDLDEGVETDMPFLMGQIAAVIEDIRPARDIVDSMVKEAMESLTMASTYARSRKESML